jgi:hypothetical protein
MLVGDPKNCPYCRVPLPRYFKQNICLQKIVDEFEEPCPNNCGTRTKKGYMKMHIEKYCPNKLIKCSECEKMIPKKDFSQHITREH